MSVRRSARSNKGINTFDKSSVYGDEELKTEEKKRKISETEPDAHVKNTSKKAKIIKKETEKTGMAENIENIKEYEKEEVRCLPCGATDLNYDEDEDNLGLMVQCVQCDTWQHSICMFGHQNKKKIPKVYKCNVCDPKNPLYKILKYKLTYDEYLKQRFPKRDGKAEKERNNKKNEGNEETEKIIQEYDPDEEQEEEIKDAGAVEDENDVDYNDTSKSRYNDDTDEEQIKLRRRGKTGTFSNIVRARTPSVESVSPKPTNFNNVKNKIRLGVITQFQRKISGLLPKNNTELLKDTTVDKLSKAWSLILEEEIFNMYPVFESQISEYTKKCRSLLMNFKVSNLVDKVVNHVLELKELPHLTEEQMLSDENKILADEVRKKSISQTVLKTPVDSGVKIRRTHKGEEIIEDNDYQFDNINSKLVDDARIEEIEKIKEENDKQRKLKEKLLKKTSPEMSDYGIDDESKIGDHNYIQSDIFSTHNEEDFDSINVEGIINEDNMLLDDEDDFNKILGKQLMPQPKHQEEKKSKCEGKAERDYHKPVAMEEIKEVGDDEEDDDYDPIDFAPLDPHIWDGSVDFPNVTDVKLSATFVTATIGDNKNELILRSKRLITDTANLKRKLDVTGRLQSSIADDYLGKITQTRDLYLIELKPFEDEGKYKFLKTWEYFQSRSKYGVVRSKPDYIKDGYILSLSKEKMINRDYPEFFRYFNVNDIMNHLNEESENSKLYVLFVAKKDLDTIFKSIDEFENDISAVTNNPLTDIMNKLN